MRSLLLIALVLPLFLYSQSTEELGKKKFDIEFGYGFFFFRPNGDVMKILRSSGYNYDECEGNSGWLGSIVGAKCDGYPTERSSGSGTIHVAVHRIHSEKLNYGLHLAMYDYGSYVGNNEDNEKIKILCRASSVTPSLRLLMSRYVYTELGIGYGYGMLKRADGGGDESSHSAVVKFGLGGRIPIKDRAFVFLNMSYVKFLTDAKVPSYDKSSTSKYSIEYSNANMIVGFGANF